jgi:PAS domain S-box-containing protein
LTHEPDCDALPPASDERFRALIEHATDAVSILDGRGEFRYVSPSHEPIFGFTPEELLGTSGFDLVHPDDMVDAQTMLSRIVAEAGSMRSLVLRLRYKSGGWRTMSLICRNLLDHPVIRGIVINGTDVTERQALEAQLRQAQKMEAVGKLAGGVAHEINNALQAVVGFTSLALEHLGPEDPARADVEEVKRAAERATRITKQLLAFSRRQVLQPVTLDLNEVVARSAVMLRQALGPERELLITPTRVPAFITADPGQLEQALLNLVLNARDAMPAGGSVTITLDQVALAPGDADRHGPGGLEPGIHVRIAVTDTGIGMDELTRSHIFEPFFTTKLPGQGTGLGLAVVHGIVRQSGGYVSVDSEPGRGTTITLHFPAANEGMRPSAPNATLARTGAPEANGAGRVVLVVDDEEVVVRLARRLLTRQGFEVRAVGDGRGALEQLDAAHARGEHIALIITDIAMPVMSGIELGRELARRAAQGTLPAVPVVYTSGYAGDEVVDRGELKAGDPFIQKPFDPATFMETVRHLVDRGG